MKHSENLNIVALFDEQRLSMLMHDACIDQIMAVDTNLNVIAWNKACESATGISRLDALGKTFYSVRPGSQSLPEIKEALRLALEGRETFVPWSKGSYAGRQEHHFIPLSLNDEILGVLITIHDVTHRVKAEMDLQRLNHSLAAKAKELQEKTEELARFNWIAAHDLKEPLRKIYTFVEMVATKEGVKLTEAARSNHRRAQSAAQRMGLLTDDIATFTQAAAPNEALANVSLNMILDNAVAHSRKAIDEQHVTIVRTPMPEIRAYPMLIQLLFNHMISNAVKFHRDNQKIRVRIGYELVAGHTLEEHGIDKEANYHCIIFGDNGIGIAREYFEQIFGVFTRLHPQGDFKGTGMGLAICRKVATAHKGFIRVESQEGEGSRFFCYLNADL